MDVDKILRAMIDRAKKNLEADGHLSACALLMHQGALILPILLSWENDNSKVDAYNMVGQKAKEIRAVGVVLINDVASRKVMPEDMAHFRQNFDTERPTTYPEGLRQEMIAVAYLDFQADKIIPYYQEYKKKGDSIEWGDLRTDSDIVIIESGFKKMIMDGYNS